MSEKYSGVKFNVNYVGKNIPQFNKNKELKQWYKVFRNKNLAPVINGQAGGNLSYRINEQEKPFVITGSQISLDTNLDNTMLVKVLDCYFDKKIIDVEGTRNPSSESFLHHAIYQKRPDINAIFHGHSTSILDNYKKENIICTKKEVPYGSIKLVNSVLEILDSKINFLIIKNHGFIALATNMQKAGKLSVEILLKFSWNSIEIQ